MKGAKGKNRSWLKIWFTKLTNSFDKTDVLRFQILQQNFPKFFRSTLYRIVSENLGYQTPVLYTEWCLKIWITTSSVSDVSQNSSYMSTRPNMLIQEKHSRIFRDGRWNIFTPNCDWRWDLASVYILKKQRTVKPMGVQTFYKQAK